MTGHNAEDIRTNTAMSQIWSSLNHADFGFHETKTHSDDSSFSSV